MREGLAGTTSEAGDQTNSTGDLISVGLRDDYQDFDFAIPFILREAEESLEHKSLDINSLQSFSAMPLAELKNLLGKGDVFISQDLQSNTLFGDYRIDGAVMKVEGYNDFLARMTRRIGQALSQPLPKGNKIAANLANPYLQANTAELTGWLDAYVRTRLFAESFEPLLDENWRVLLLQSVLDHITKVIALALLEAENRPLVGESEVRHRCLSEVGKLTMRESSSLVVNKCIYPRLPYPARNGGLEKAFIEWADKDGSVQAFCKLSETRHDFARLRYVKDDGLPAFYSPDFLLRAAESVYLVETKAQQQTTHPNVRRKLKAAAAWCEKVNTLPAELRSGLSWHYVLLGESVFWDWRGKGERLVALCAFAKVRNKPVADAQQTLAWD